MYKRQVRDTGVGNRAIAATLALPYAALETLPEFFLAGRILNVGSIGKNILTKGRAPTRFVKGTGVGGTLEGLTELGQEAIILAGTGQLTDAETTKRLINSFAAGFAIGGPIGGLTNLKKNKPADILNPDGNPDDSTKKAIADNKGPDPTQPSLFAQEDLPASPVIPGRSATQNLEQPDLFPGSAAVAQAETAGQLRLDATTDTATDTDIETVQTQEPQPQVAQQLNLPLGSSAQEIVDTVQTTPDTQRTAIGEQLLQAANNKILQQEQELAQQKILAQETQIREQRQREFDMAQKEVSDRKIKELEDSLVTQILAENDRLTRESEDRKARERDMILSLIHI